MIQHARYFLIFFSRLSKRSPEPKKMAFKILYAHLLSKISSFPAIPSLMPRSQPCMFITTSQRVLVSTESDSFPTEHKNDEEWNRFLLSFDHVVVVGKWIAVCVPQTSEMCISTGILLPELHLLRKIIKPNLLYLHLSLHGDTSRVCD